MDHNEARRRIQQAMLGNGQIGASQEGVRYGMPVRSAFRVDGNGASLELLSLLIAGDRAQASRLAGLNQGVPSAAQLPAGTMVVLPSDMQAPSWQEPYALDPFNRSNLNYWTARALEAAFDAPGSVLGATAVTACTLGKTGQPGECCDPTSDAFPSKPYFYKVPYPVRGEAIKRPEEVARDFGRDENGWIELRRANADDPDGFVKQENKWCWWKVWGAGKILRIPGSWAEAEFTAAVIPHLVYRNGYQFRMEELASSAQLFLRGMPNRWPTPIHMMIECGRQLWSNPATRPGLDLDPIIAKEITTRTFLAK